MPFLLRPRLPSRSHCALHGQIYCSEKREEIHKATASNGGYTETNNYSDGADLAADADADEDDDDYDDDDGDDDEIIIRC